MGEYNKEGSYMAQSAKGVIHHNIPGGLVMLLRGMSHESILDFSLGCSGRYYIKWKDPQGVVKQNGSSGLWRIIDQDPNVELDHLSIGAGDVHWGVRVTGSGNASFHRLEPTASAQIGMAELISGLSDIRFVSLGAGGTFCYNAAGTIHLDALPIRLRAKLQTASEEERTITNVVLSPHSTANWVIMYAGGKYDGMLPASWLKDLAPHVQSQYSLLLQATQSPSAAFPVVSKTPVRALITTSTEFLELRNLFLKGWQHPGKGLPSIVNICAIDLPQSLLRPYQAYRSQLEKQPGNKGSMSKRRFMGRLGGAALATRLIPRNFVVTRTAISA
ncbi:hypothetical protein FRB95_007584 [Tulasnella sp. JGI-2019a]|nr:hypothetical protein FRB95_007584 [Tulasnella sp. JGI-2019a]